MIFCPAGPITDDTRGLPWSSLACAVAAALFSAVAACTSPTPDDLIRYETLNYRFDIPYKFVVPGTYPGQPPAQGFDSSGPDIFIWFDGEYAREHVPGLQLRGGKDDQYYRHIHVNLTDTAIVEGDRLTDKPRYLDALRLSGEFEGGFVERDESSGLYRVFREHQGQKLSGFWDLVRQEPDVQFDTPSYSDELGVGVCYRMMDGVETRCTFTVNILGMKAAISAAEDEYLRLGEIERMIEAHLHEWRVAGS